MASLEILVGIAIGAIVAHLIGKTTHAERTSIVQCTPASRQPAYLEIFEAFVFTDRALMDAYIQETSEKEVSEHTKVVVREAMNNLLRAISRAEFLLPSEFLLESEGFPNWKLSMSWSEKLDALRESRKTFVAIARKDVGGNIFQHS